MTVTPIRPTVAAVASVVVSRKHSARRAAQFLWRTLPLGLGRGVAAWCRAWWRWKTLAAVTERCVAEGKASAGEDKRQERRDQRTVQSICSGLVLLIAAGLFVWLAPTRYLVAAAVVTLLGLFASGHTWRPQLVAPDEPEVERPPGWDGGIESIHAALTAAGVLKKATKTVKGQHVWITKGTHPERVGSGTQLVLDLDRGVTWEHVLAKRVAVASGLAVDGDFMVVEKGRHDGQARVWLPDGDPYADGPARYPLLDVDEWNAWRPAPFALTPHGKTLNMSLIGSNYLGGGKPGSGKSFSARPVVAPFILDPTCRVFVANGKGDAAWEPVRDLSVKYIRGARPEHVWEFHAVLNMLIEEMDRRYDASTTSKVEEGGEFAPWLLIADEVQEYLGSDEPTEFTARGKKNAPLGKVLDEMMTRLARLGRAAGIIVVMLSQRPDDTVMSLALRSMFGTRFCNRTMSAGTGEIILGVRPGPGTDASKVPTKYKGLGILVPDGEKVDIDGTPLCRPFFISDADWQALGARGYRLRRDAGVVGWARGSEHNAMPLPELLEQILDVTSGMDGEERIPSRVLRAKLGIDDKDETAFGLQLRKWGCPTGRDRGGLPLGPLVGDVRAAAQRIREGGRIHVLNTA